MRKPFFLSIFIVFSLFELSSQGLQNPHIKMSVGIYVKYINLDESNGKFYADMYWWLKIPSGNNSDSTYLESISKIEFVNTQNIISNEIDERKFITSDSIKYFYKTGTIKAVFNYQPDFRKYPVDIQDLSIIIESPLLTDDSLVLLVDGKDDYQQDFIDQHVVINGFKLEHSFKNSVRSFYKTDFGDIKTGNASYSRYIFTLQIKRNYISFIYKILIPNFLLLIIAYLVFFIPSKELEVAVGCTVTSLLASIALQLTIDNNMPKIGYTTNADKLFYLFYFLIASALVQTVVSYTMAKRGFFKTERRLEMLGRIIYPIILVFGIFIILRH